MIFDVYRLCHHGLPLRAEQAQARGPVRGDLRLSTQVAQGRHATLAQLLVPGSDEDYALPVLLDAALKKVGADGMLFVGTEVIPRAQGHKSRVDYYAQRWLCKPPNC